MNVMQFKPGTKLTKLVPTIQVVSAGKINCGHVYGTEVLLRPILTMLCSSGNYPALLSDI